MTNVPVMLLFFNRPDTLRQVFEAVRKAQPKQLFLVQDGARADRPDDPAKVQACREIVEQVDWPCEVYKNYATENMSCDHREFTGIDWCFEHVDRLMILEDDCVPSQTFFRMCEELLEKYKDDDRIATISGFNRTQEYPSPYDYVFSMTNAGWGWATWKRFWDQVRENRDLDRLADTDYIRTHWDPTDKSLVKTYGAKFIEQGLRCKALSEQTGKVNSWEYLVGFTMIMNHMLAITPTKNMSKYIGISADATHCHADVRIMPHKTRRVLTQPHHEFDHPLRHPPQVVRDVQFEEADRKAFRYPPYVANIEGMLLKLRYGDFTLIRQVILRRLKH